MNLNQVTMASQNIEESVDFYVRLGFEIVVLAPHYARFLCPDGSSSFSVHLVDFHKTSSATVVYFEFESVEALEQKVSALGSAGLVFSSPVTAQSWLWTEARLNDPSGNEICLYYGGENRLNPPWRFRGSGGSD